MKPLAFSVIEGSEKNRIYLTLSFCELFDHTIMALFVIIIDTH